MLLAASSMVFASGSSESDSDGHVTITMMDSCATEDPHGKYVYEYAEKYMAEHPNVTIEIQGVSSNEIMTRLSAMATSPDDLPTIFFTSADQVPTLYDLGLTADLNDLITDEDRAMFVDGALDVALINGEQVYIPIYLQPTGIIYRMDRFEEEGLSVPSNWDEFVECARALTRDTDGDGVVDEWGFDMVGSNDSSGQTRFMNYLWSCGFDVVYEENGEWKTDITADPEFLEVFSRWTDMNEEGLVPIGITEVNYSTAANYFAMGYADMIVTGPNALGVAYASNPDLQGKLGSFMLVGDAPGSMLGASGYAITSYASDEEKAAAYDFLKYFITNDSDYMFWRLSGKMPVTKEGQNVDFIQGEDYAGFRDQVNSECRPTITFAGINAVKSALGDAYSAVFSGEMTNEEAVNQLVKDIAEVLEDYS